MFQAPKLTDAGKALYYNNIGGHGISFTTIKLGKGTLSGPIATLTDLIDTVVTIDASISNGNDRYVDIYGSFSNFKLSEGFYWREIGVFAADPNYPDDRSKDVLYCYQNAFDTADFIPVASVETVEKHITVPLIVGDAENVSCLIDSSLVVATQKDIINISGALNEHAQDATVHVTEKEKNTWDNKASTEDIRRLEQLLTEHNSDTNAHAELFAKLASPPVAFSVDVSDWSELAESFAGCGYSAEIAAEGVTSADFPDIYFDEASIGSAAGIIVGTDSGKVVLYAGSIPAVALSGTYFIRKGV